MNNLQSICTVIAMCAASISTATIAQNAGAKLDVNFTGIDEKEGAILGVVLTAKMPTTAKARRCGKS